MQNIVGLYAHEAQVSAVIVHKPGDAAGQTHPHLGDEDTGDGHVNTVFHEGLTVELQTACLYFRHLR